MTDIQILKEAKKITDFNQEMKEITNYQTLKYLMVTQSKVDLYHNIVVSISGGSDSDIMVDMFTKFDPDKKVKFVWFDTGIEYQATKDHLKYLEDKYGIEIHREKAIKPIPTSVKEYGIPFLSKFISEFIGSLQAHNFDFKNDGNKSYEELIVKYPKIKSRIAWWCNCNGKNKDGIPDNRFNIKGKRYLKEFMIQNPPDFKISKKCCKYAKKDVAKKFNKENQTDLNVIGVRKAEGGIRSSAYKNCFTRCDDTYDEYRPLFFFTDDDKQYYKEYFDIKYSDCYEVWGMKRTGCAGCPYGGDIDEKLENCKKYEPKLYNACINIFGKSYDYTKRYYEFRDKMKQQEKQNIMTKSN